MSDYTYTIYKLPISEHFLTPKPAELPKMASNAKRKKVIILFFILIILYRIQYKERKRRYRTIAEYRQFEFDLSA